MIDEHKHKLFDRAALAKKEFTGVDAHFNLFRYWRYRPHESQRKLHKSGARFRLAVCGRRFGKSTAAAYEAACHAFIPDGRIWIVAPYRELAGRVFEKVREILVHKMKAPPEIDRRAEMRLSFGWGAEICGKTADNPDSLLGEGLDFAVVDEAPAVDGGIFARYIMPSLADKRGCALIIGSPRGRGWIWELERNAAGNPKWDIFHFPSSANPHLDPGELSLHRRLMSEADYMREYEARWTAEAPLVYPMFERALHSGEAEYNPALPLYAGMDFGFANPGCALFAQLTPSEKLIVLNEIYARGMTGGEWAEALKAKIREITAGAEGARANPADALYIGRAKRILAFGNGRAHPEYLPEEPVRGGKPGAGNVAVFCDPAGAGERAALVRAGIAAVAAGNGVAGGIARVRALLSPGDPAVPPRILVSRKCRNLIREFESYEYEKSGPSAILPRRGCGGSPGLENGGGRALLDFSAPSCGIEKPLKRDDHALDALRYLVMGLGL